MRGCLVDATSAARDGSLQDRKNQAKTEEKAIGEKEG
jgi:hypothetical protein